MGVTSFNETFLMLIETPLYIIGYTSIITPMVRQAHHDRTGSP